MRPPRFLTTVIVLVALLAGATTHAGQIRFTFGVTRSIDACEDAGDRIRYRSDGTWYDIRKADVQEITELTCTPRDSGGVGHAASGAQEEKWETHMRAGIGAYQQNRYTEAEKAFRAALKEAEQSGPEDLTVAESLENYAALLRKLNRQTEAGQLQARAKAIRGKPDQPSPKQSWGVEYAEAVRKAPSFALAVEYLRMEEVRRLADQVGEGTFKTLTYGEAVTQANVEDFVRRLDRKIQILSGEMMPRGFASVAGQYDVQQDVKNECGLPQGPLGPISVSQDKSSVEFKDAAGVLNGGGVIVESSLALKTTGRQGLSPHFYIGAFSMGRIELGFLDTSYASNPNCKIGALIKRK